MDFGCSLANYDIDKLSAEMEKFGGGINIKKCKNIIKYITMNDLLEENKRLLKNDIGSTRLMLKRPNEAYYKCLDSEEDLIKDSLMAGFNVNVLNFYGDGCLSNANEISRIVRLYDKLRSDSKQYDLCVSVYRISYDETSKQELLFDLTSTKNYMVHNLKDMQICKISSSSELTQLLELSKNLNNQYSDPYIWSTCFLQFLLIDEAEDEAEDGSHGRGGRGDGRGGDGKSRRIHSSLRVIEFPEFNQAKEKFPNISAYVTRINKELKGLLKDAQNAKILNKDTLDDQYVRKSKLIHYIYTHCFQNAQNIVLVYFSPTLTYEESKTRSSLFRSFQDFELITYKSTSSRPLTLSSFEGIKSVGNLIAEGTTTPSLNKSPKGHMKKVLAKLKSEDEITQVKLGSNSGARSSFTEIPIAQQQTKDQKLRGNSNEGYPSASGGGGVLGAITAKPMPETMTGKSYQPMDYPDRPFEFQIPDIEKDFTRKYSKFNISGPSKGITTYTGEMLAHGEIKKNYEKFDEVRKELLKRNEELENEIFKLKVDHNKEIEEYRTSLKELNTKYQILLGKDPDLKPIIDNYEKEIIKLELRQKNLREQLDIFTTIDNTLALNPGSNGLLAPTTTTIITPATMAMATTSAYPGNMVTSNMASKHEEEYKKMKELMRVLNLDLISCEEELNKMKRIEREKKSNVVLGKKIQERLEEVIKEKMFLEDENIKLYEKMKSLNALIDNLKKENHELNLLTQNQAIQILNVDEESKLLKDILNLEKINVSENVKQKFLNPQQDAQLGQNLYKKDVFYTVIGEIIELLPKIVPNKDKIPNALLEKLKGIYHNQVQKNGELNTKLKKYLDFMSDIQIKLEKHLGKNDDFVKECNKQIRNFLAENLQL